MAASTPRKPKASISSQTPLALAGIWSPAYDIGPIYEGPYLQFNPAMHIDYNLTGEGCYKQHQSGVLSTNRSFPMDIRVAEWENVNQEGDVLQFKCREVVPGQIEHYKHNAVLRSMFITQPPTTGIQLQIQVNYRSGWEARMSLYNPQGITLGDVFDGIVSEVAVDEVFFDDEMKVLLVFSQKMANNSESAREGWCETCHWVEGVRQDRQ